MVINTNLSGAGGAQLPDAVNRIDPRGRKIPSPGQSETPGANMLPLGLNQAGQAQGCDITDGGAATKSVQFARSAMLGQPATAMQAHGNISPEMVMNLLEG